MLSERTIFQSPAWNKLQTNLPGRRAGTLHQLYWSIIPTLWGQRYLYLNRPAHIDLITQCWEELVRLAKKEKCMYIKLEPAWHKDERTDKQLLTMGFHHSPFHIQPDTTLYLNITMSLVEILKQMKPKGRYNIKIADKHHITYANFAGNDTNIEVHLQQFYNVLETTAKRDSFSIHSYQHYLTFLRELGTHSKLYLAYYQDQIVAGLIATFYNKQAIYYYGASDSQNRQTMATYGLQWQAIQDAKEVGMNSYDFLGIAPSNSDHSHPWHGVTDFKRKFGGVVYEYPGTYHYPIQRTKYFFLNTLKQVYYEAKKFIQRHR